MGQVERGFVVRVWCSLLLGHLKSKSLGVVVLHSFVNVNDGQMIFITGMKISYKNGM